MQRKSYDIKEKRSVVQKVDGYISAGYLQEEACFRIGFSTLYYRCWVKVLKKVDDMNAGDESCPTRPMEQRAKFTQAERVFLLE